MPAVQSSYNATLAAAYAGMVANMELSNIVSRTLKLATMSFGAVAVQGATDLDIRAPFASTFSAAKTDVVGAGKGILTLANPAVDVATVKAGVYRVVFIEPASNAGAFQVEDPDGVVVGTGNAAVAFDGPVKFTIADGATDFVAGDVALVTVSALTAPRFLGITVLDRAVDPSSPDLFRINDTVPVLTKGVIWVTVTGAVVAGDPAFFSAAGAIGASGAFPIPNSRFDTAASDGGLAKLRIG